MLTFRLPKINKKTPYQSFYAYITKRLGKKKGYKLNQSVIFMSHENEETLSLAERASYPQLKKMIKRHADMSWGMHHLNYSPAVHPCVHNGFVLVDEKKVWVKEDK